MKFSSSLLVFLCALICTRECLAILWFESIEDMLKWQARKLGLIEDTTPVPQPSSEQQMTTNLAWLLNNENDEDQPTTLPNLETTTSTPESTTASLMAMFSRCCDLGKRAESENFHACSVEDYAMKQRLLRSRDQHGRYNNMNPYAYIQSQQNNKCFVNTLLTKEFKRCCKRAYSARYDRPSFNQPIKNARYIDHVPNHEEDVNIPRSRYTRNRKHNTGQ